MALLRPQTNASAHSPPHRQPRTLLTDTMTLLVLLCLVSWAEGGKDGVVLPSKCETCKFMAMELEAKFRETGKTHQVVETAIGKRKKYRDSELRFLETVEGVCERLMTYNLHKEHQDSNRFAKGMSNTMKTLHGLVEKGVKVDLGIPLELWDSPSVEVTTMKQQCETILEEFEDDLEQWFLRERDLGRRGKPLTEWLCRDRVLRLDNAACLDEKPKQVKGDKVEL